MPKIFDFLSNQLPPVTEIDVRRFSSAIDVRDAQAFAAELQVFVEEHMSKAISSETVEQELARKALELRAASPWEPGETEIQRGRSVLLADFQQPHNLPLPKFAQLAHKSRQQIYKDIDARRLLALNVGRRGQKLPDWQLDSEKQQLTEVVLQKTKDIDAWTLYRALSEPLDGLGGLSPVDAIPGHSIEDVADAVLNVLGIH